MDIKKLIRDTRRPELYEKGSAEMWTDPYISQQLLPIHLDEERDSASRSVQNRGIALELISGFLPSGGMKVLDLGCGPGLYCEALAGMGHRVTGVDFSENSITHARREAGRKGLDIDYRCTNYLDLDFSEEFDLIFLIYNDFSVLLPPDRDRLLARVHRALKKGGSFIFDVINDMESDERFIDETSWSLAEKGFWRPAPYLELTSAFHYPEKQVYLKQYCIYQEAEEAEIFRFWFHYYSSARVKEMLEAVGFRECRNYEGLLPDLGIWEGEFLSFYSAQKN